MAEGRNSHDCEVCEIAAELAEERHRVDRYRSALERIAGRRPGQADAAQAFYRCREDARQALAGQGQEQALEDER